MGSSTENCAYGPTHNPWDLVAHPGRLVRWLVRRGRRVPGAAGDRHRHRRLDPPAGRRHRHRRVQAHLRQRLAVRADRVLVLARPGRPVRADGARHRAAVRGDGRPRPVRLDLDPRPGRARRRGRTRGRVGRPVRRCASAWCANWAARATSPSVLARFDDAVTTLQGPRRRGRRGLVPALRVRPAGVLPDRAERVLVQPRPLRRRPVRPARRRRRRALARGRHVADARGGLRRRGEAPHHDRDVRAVVRLLRRVLRPGAEGAHAHRPRLRGGVRAVRRARLADVAVRRVRASASGRPTRWRCTSTTSARCPPRSPGTPAISVPCGLAEDLPVGLQIMAPALADERCFRVGAAYEAAVPTLEFPEL